MWFPVGLDRLSLKILDLLCQENGLPVPEIDRRLGEIHGLVPALATLYRRIERLQENHLIVRHKARCWLNPIWVEHLSSQMQALGSRSKQPQITLPAREGEAVELCAGSLRLLDPLWNLVLLELGRAAPDRTLYGYNGRGWYALGMTESECALYHALQSHGVRTHLLLGSAASIDEQAAGLVHAAGLRTNLTSRPPFASRGYAVWASRSFTVECHFPQSVSQQLNEPLARAQTADELDRQLLSQAFDMKGRCAVRVVRSRKRAARVYETLARYF